MARKSINESKSGNTRRTGAHKVSRVSNVHFPGTVAIAAVGSSGRSILFYGMTIADRAKIIRAGVAKKELINIKTALGLDYDELSDVLSASRTTLISKKPAQKFDKQISERIVMLADVMNFGYEIFGDHEIFNRWLKTPSEGLGNVTPLSMMDTLYGIDEIKKEIGRIAYGVY